MSATAPARGDVAGEAAEALRRLTLDETAKAAVLASPALRAVARRIAARSIPGDTLADARPAIAAANARGHAAVVVDAIAAPCRRFGRAGL